MDRMLPGIIHPVVLLGAYAVLWFLCLFCLIPIGLGAVDPVTGAPLSAGLGWKTLCASVLATLLWLVFYLAIRWGWVQV